LRVTTGQIPSGCFKIRTEIFQAEPASRTLAAGLPDPADPDSLTFGKFYGTRTALLHSADNLMSQNKRQ
jgi:hypothetical protein